MDRRSIFYLVTLLILLTLNIIHASPILHAAVKEQNVNTINETENITTAKPRITEISTTEKATTERSTQQGKYFNQVIKELNQALKEKAAEEREHINLLMNMTAEMKELSEQVKGMQVKLKKIIEK